MNNTIKYTATFTVLASLAAGTLLFDNNSKNIENKSEPSASSNYTSLDLDKMTENINNLGLYKVYDGTVPVKHKSIFKFEHKFEDTIKDKSFFGLDEEITLSGEANCYYEYLINLSKVTITRKGDKVVVKCPRAFLNRDTIKRSSKVNFIDEECSQNFGSLVAIEDSQKEAMAKWEDSFEDNAYKRILSSQDQLSIDISTRSAIKFLMEKFGVSEDNLDIVLFDE